MRRRVAGILAAALMQTAALHAADGEKTPLDYARDLESADAKIRREAAYQLSRPGVASKAAIPQLIKALEDDQQQVWFGAITALSNLKGDAEAALPALMKELEAWQPFRKDRQGTQALYRTALALGSIGAPAVPALSNALTSGQWHVRAGAARALSFAGGTASTVAPRLASALADDRVEVREAAAETLAVLGTVALGPLTETLVTADDPKARATAAMALGRLGRDGAPAEAVLKQAALEEKDTAARVQALVAFSRVVPGSPALVPVLMRAWEDSEESVRRAAHSALLLVRPVDQALLPSIVPLLNSPEESVRARAAQLIAELGPDGASAVASVEAALRRSVAAGKPDPLLMQALAALGDRGLAPVFASLEQEPTSALTAADWRLAVLRQVQLTSLARLTEALSHPSASVRAGALEGLIALGDRARSVAKRLPPLLEDTDPAVRSRGWMAAGACGVAAEVMLGRLELGLNDASPEVRRAVVSGVARLGKAARPAIPKLVESLGTGDAALELAAVRALGSMGAEAESAAGPLADRVSRSTPEVQVEVLAALGAIGTGAASEVGKLLPLGDAPNPQVRRAFFEAVGKFRAGGKPALPAVERGLKDSDPGVRAAAVQARVAVEPESEAAVQAAVDGLQDAEGEVRRASAGALAVLEERGRPGEARLFALLADPADREAARDALRAIHPTSVPSLLEALRHADWGVREMAADALARLGKGAEEAAGALEKASREDASEDVKRASRRALRRIREG
jgi:HEAT repeat protein